MVLHVHFSLQVPAPSRQQAFQSMEAETPSVFSLLNARGLALGLALVGTFLKTVSKSYVQGAWEWRRPGHTETENPDCVFCELKMQLTE